ncbi:RCC1 and BTB domain-containing protein [Thraustotheca clavata]|uniref:RCC1 and BTB domain-containing protein n=1 Tax=Thraustotheca clavata TaxID=74557 RepID=A0A1V9Z8D5_9STRA|nr:RCC1 and BTB domain-containing protein [Thraustotheca clavata]
MGIMDEEEAAVYTFGQNSYGELGLGDTTTRFVPSKVEFCIGKNVVDVACGNENTVILCGNGEVLACGYNDSGQCGTGTAQRVTAFKPLTTLFDKQVVKLSAGNGCEHVVAITDNGELYTFGYNARGQLGQGNTTPLSVPTLVEGLACKAVVKVSCSYFHTVAVTEENEVYAFGRNDFGQLGIPDALDKHVPHPIPFFSGKKVLSVACGQYHTVVSLASGGVYAFGKNDYGQLGIDAPGVKSVPVLISAPLDTEVVVHLACGYYHTTALTQSGKVYTFGRNDFGQLGLGHKYNVYKPTLVSALNDFTIVDIACGCYHTLALRDTGIVYPFGRNNHGQLGTDNNIDSSIPTYIESLRHVKVRKIAAGFYHTVCVTGPLKRDVVPVLRSSLGHDLSKLLNNPQRSDVEFVVEGISIYAHRCILMIRCEPLDAMLNGSMRESLAAQIVIPHQSHAAFLAMLEYIYTDEVTALDHPATIDIEFVLDLIALADQFLLSNLKLKCERAIQKSIDFSNVTKLLETAHIQQAHYLKKCCIDFVLANFGLIIASPGFVDLHPELMQEILTAASRRGVIIKPM